MNKDGVTGLWPVMFVILTTFWPSPQLSQFYYDRVISFTQTSKTGTNFTVLTFTSDGDLLCTNLDTQGSTQNPKLSDTPSCPQIPHTLTNLPFVAPIRSPTQPILYDSYTYSPPTHAYPPLCLVDNPQLSLSPVPPTGNDLAPIFQLNGQLDMFLFDQTFGQPMPNTSLVFVFSLTRLIPNPPTRHPHWMLSITSGINDQVPLHTAYSESPDS